MRIRELLSYGSPSISFEFFPPKDETGWQALRDALAGLRDLHPTYVSVTYGAGGSTRDRTIELVTHIRRDYGIEAMAHLTCVGASRDEISQVLTRLRDGGIENVLALRGDPPKGAETFQPHPDGFQYAGELAAFIRAKFPFCLGGACYPEKHPEAVGFDADLKHLKAKVDAGVEFLITQLFFDNRFYYEFVAKARRLGIGAPILPGIMPITNVAQVERFTKMCGASLPEELMAEMRRIQHDPAAVMALGVAHATAQCIDLLQHGAPGIHFYTLNKSPAARTILTAIREVYPPARTPAGWRGNM
ncbi:MAG: methylenetetrahydrofolate reductase [NAD(P)H] [Phycisphaerales bacterium]|nr:methylenetetrahydrofolate reductase [NAD(P)H] [Phycisphaerales bacterium]